VTHHHALSARIARWAMFSMRTAMSDASLPARAPQLGPEADPRDLLAMAQGPCRAASAGAHLLQIETCQLSMPYEKRTISPPGTPDCSSAMLMCPNRIGAPAAEKSGQVSPVLQVGPSTRTKCAWAKLGRCTAYHPVPLQPLVPPTDLGAVNLRPACSISGIVKGR
jgi:hypothetical protein